jgi:hypothetical protein
LLPVFVIIHIFWQARPFSLFCTKSKVLKTKIRRYLPEL